MSKVRYFSSESAKRCGYILFDRHHGVSEGVFASLNTSFGVGDRAGHVRSNRRQVKREMAVDCLLSARQVHGDRICTVGERPAGDLEVDGYDALITDQCGVGLMIQHADCQAVLLFDPRLEVIAAVHCGWRGAVAELLAKTVERMGRDFGSRPADLQAVISPSLGPCCSEFIHHERELPAAFKRFMVRENHFDFWQISRHQLIHCGVAAEQVTLPEHCTRCSADYFSYRRARYRDDGVTGRNCSVIALYP